MVYILSVGLLEWEGAHSRKREIDMIDRLMLGSFVICVFVRPSVRPSSFTKLWTEFIRTNTLSHHYSYKGFKWFDNWVWNAFLLSKIQLKTLNNKKERMSKSWMWWKSLDEQINEDSSQFYSIWKRVFAYFPSRYTYTPYPIINTMLKLFAVLQIEFESIFVLFLFIPSLSDICEYHSSCLHHWHLHLAAFLCYSFFEIILFLPYISIIPFTLFTFYIIFLLNPWFN